MSDPLAESLIAVMDTDGRSAQYGQVDGKAFLSDGRQLVILDRDLGLGEWSGFTKVESLRRLLDRCPLPAEAPLIRLADLLEFAGQPLPPCERCHGKGYVRGACSDCNGTGTYDCECDCGRSSHEVDCDDCGGEGKADINCPGCNGGPYRSRPGNILGGLFNLSLIGPTLGLIQASEARIAVVPLSDGGGVLNVWGEGFRYLLMSMRDAPKDEPAFSIPADQDSCKTESEAGMSGRK